MRYISVPHPGVCFLFRWRRFRIPFLKPSYGIGQVLSLEPEESTVHLRIFTTDKTDDWPYLIGHLPIHAQYFAPWVAKKLDKLTLHNDFWPSIIKWRELYQSGEAASFSVPLPRAIELILRTVNEEGLIQDPEEPITSAFPAPGPSGNFSAIIASTWAPRGA